MQNENCFTNNRFRLTLKRNPLTTINVNRLKNLNLLKFTFDEI